MTEPVVFAALFFLVPAVAYVLFRIGGLTFARPSPAAVVVAYFIANAYAGVWVLFFEESPRAISRGVTEHGLVWSMFGMAAGTLLVMAAAFALTPGRGSIRVRRGFLPLSGPGMGMIGLLLAVSVAVLAAYLISLPSVPLFAAVQGEAKEAVALRTTAATSNYVRFGKPQYYHAFIRVLLPFLAYVLFAQAVVRKRMIFKLVAAAGIGIAVFASVVDTSKGGLVGIILGCGLTYLALVVRRIRWRHVIVGSAIAAGASAVMVVTFMGTAFDDPWTLTRDLAERVLIGNLIPAYHVLDMFRQEDLLWGRTFPNPLGLLPFTPYDLDTVLWLRSNPHAAGDTIYSAPSVLWAEMYANFGVPGVLLTAPFIGMFLKLLQSVLNTIHCDPVRAALIAFTSVYFMNLVNKGIGMLFGLPFDYYLMVVIVASWAIVVADRSRRRRHGAPAGAPRPRRAAAGHLAPDHRLQG